VSVAGGALVAALAAAAALPFAERAEAAADRAEPAAEAAEDARDLAQGYAADAAQVSGVNVPIYATRASAEGSDIAEAVTSITLQGHTVAGDHPPVPMTEIDFGAVDKPWHITTNVNTRRWKQVTDGLMDCRPFGIKLDTLSAAASNTGKLQDVFDCCQEEGGGIGGRIPGNVYFDGQVTSEALSPLVVHGVMTFTGGGEDALVFGEPGARVIPARDMVVPSIINIERAEPDYTDQFAGVVFRNCSNHVAWISVDSFYLGVDHYAAGSATHYNSFYLKRINRAQIGVRIWAKNGSAINESNWYAGEWQSPLSSADDVIGVQFRKDAGGFVINSHKFWGPSFEMSNAGAGDAVLINGYSPDGETTIARNCMFYGMRWENPDKLISGDGITSFYFGLSYTAIAGATLATAALKPDNGAARLRLMANTFDFSRDGPYGWGEPVKIGEVGRRHVVGQTPSATLLTTKPARGCIYVAEPTYKLVFHNATVSLKHGSVVVSTGQKVIFGMLFDLRTAGEDYNRRITVKVHTTTAGGRIAAVCYDASFNRLEDAEDCSLAFNASNGLFRQGADLTVISNEAEVLFGPDVAYVILGVAGGTAAADFKKVEFFAPIGADMGVCYDPEVVTGIGVSTVNSIAVAPMIDTDQPLATQLPTEPADTTPGTGNSYPFGLKVMNVDPTNAEAPGWMRGATWIPDGERGGVVADVGNSAATLTVNSSKVTQIWNTPLTADRAVTLSTTGAVEGAKFVIVRTAAATGAFNLNVGTGPLKALAAGSRCEVTYNGSAWVLTGYSTL